MAGSKGGTEVFRYALVSKNVLTPEEQELYELTQLAGVILDPSVFKIVLDLLKLNVAPMAILQMLKSMCGSRRKKTPEAAAAVPSSSSRAQEEFRKPKAKTSSRTRPASQQSTQPSLQSAYHRGSSR